MVCDCCVAESSCCRTTLFFVTRRALWAPPLSPPPLLAALCRPRADEMAAAAPSLEAAVVKNDDAFALSDFPALVELVGSRPPATASREELTTWLADVRARRHLAEVESKYFNADGPAKLIKSMKSLQVVDGVLVAVEDGRQRVVVLFPAFVLRAALHAYCKAAGNRGSVPVKDVVDTLQAYGVWAGGKTRGAIRVVGRVVSLASILVYSRRQLDAMRRLAVPPAVARAFDTLVAPTPYLTKAVVDAFCASAPTDKPLQHAIFLPAHSFDEYLQALIELCGEAFVLRATAGGERNAGTTTFTLNCYRSGSARSGAGGCRRRRDGHASGARQ